MGISAIKRWLSKAFGEADQRMSVTDHQMDDGSHMITVKSLRVIVLKHPDHWVAQAVDFDYVATGVSLDEVRHNFLEDLAATIVENIKEYGTVEHLFARPPPAEIKQMWFELTDYKVDESDLPELSRELENIKAIPRRIAFVRQLEPLPC
jgi:hypothetical protein